MPIRRKLIDDLRGFLNTMPLSDMIMLGIAESVENIRSLLRYLEGRADELDFLFDHGPSTIVSSIRGYK